MRQALEQLRVVEDWSRKEETYWCAEVNEKTHEMRGETANGFKNVYLVGGRRKNALCGQFADGDALKKWQAEWVYDHTFA